MGSCQEAFRRLRAPPSLLPRLPRASTVRMHCCTKLGTVLLSRSHSTASAQPNTWSGGEAGRRRPACEPPAPRSPRPSGTFDVALLPQRLHRGPPQQELAELVPDPAQVALQAPRAWGRGCCWPQGNVELRQSVALGLARQAPVGSSPPSRCPPAGSPLCTPAWDRASSSRQLPRRSLDPKSTLLCSLSSSGGRSADWNQAASERQNLGPAGVLLGWGEEPELPSLQAW